MKHRRLLLIALVVASCLHLAAAAGALWAGRAHALGGAFEPDGVAAFASDGLLYRRQVAELETKLKREGFAAWARAKVSSHVKLYSLSYALFGPLFGRTILSAEPLNLLYYLTTLLLIYAIGSELYDRRAGLAAAAFFALASPTFLMHTTQLLKDPLFVALALALVLCCLRLVTRDYRAWRGGLTAGLAGGASASALWSVRASMWWVVLAIIFLACLLSVARQARMRAALKGNLAGAALMVFIALCASHVITYKTFPQEPLASDAADAEATRAREEGAGESRDETESRDSPAAAGLLSPLVERVGRTRDEFIELYPDAASNVDEGVRLRTLSDVVVYLPRAALVGLCAPFPSMWTGAGAEVGRWGRVVAGCETFLMYFVEALALYGLWRGRRRPGVWLLMLTALVGVTALGLIVVNVGALYRMRYLFWVLFAVVAAGTAVELFDARRGGAGRAFGEAR